MKHTDEQREAKACGGVRASVSSAGRSQMASGQPWANRAAAPKADLRRNLISDEARPQLKTAASHFILRKPWSTVMPPKKVNLGQGLFHHPRANLARNQQLTAATECAHTKIGKQAWRLQLSPSGSRSRRWAHKGNHPEVAQLRRQLGQAVSASTCRQVWVYRAA